MEIIQHLLALPQAAQHTWRLYADSPPPPGLFPLRTPGAAGTMWRSRFWPPARLWTRLALRHELVRHPPQVVFVPAHVLPWPTWGLPPSVVPPIPQSGLSSLPGEPRGIPAPLSGLGHPVERRLRPPGDRHRQATAQDLARFDDQPAKNPGDLPEAAGPPLPSDRPLIPSVAELPPYALFVSTIQPRKNVERLVRAFAFLVKTKTISWDLVLAGGKGWLSDRLYGLTGELGVADRVHFLGYVDNTNLPGLYAHARLFCYPSSSRASACPFWRPKVMECL